MDAYGKRFRSQTVAHDPTVPPAGATVRGGRLGSLTHLKSCLAPSDDIPASTRLGLSQASPWHHGAMRVFGVVGILGILAEMVIFTLRK